MIDVKEKPAPPAIVKPLLRGWLHLGAFPLVLAAGIVLIVLSPSTASRVAASVFTLTAALLFGVSAIYHRGNWSEKNMVKLKRFDHCNIFLIIAGTYTPLSVLLLPPGKATILLSIVWVGALAGVAFKVFFLNAPRALYTPIYVALGWVAVFYLPDFLRSGGVAVTTLIIAGGVFYSLGALAYGLKRPDPSPKFFGYHEIFHTFTLLGFAAHTTAIFLSTLSPTVNA